MESEERIFNCSVCDFCYSNETMNCLYLCVNGASEYLGEFVDGLGLASEDYECVVINGKSREELLEEEIILEECHEQNMS